MERNFSVDDIVGTLWKLDTNSDSNHGHGHGAEQTQAMERFWPSEDSSKKMICSRSDSEWALEEFLKKNQPETIHNETSATSFPQNGMNRIDSMAAFQEFLRTYGCGDLNPNQGSGKVMNRNDSVVAFQEFIRTHGSGNDSNPDSNNNPNPNSNPSLEFGKAMNRSDSLFAIQEFIRIHSGDTNDSNSDPNSSPNMVLEKI